MDQILIGLKQTVCYIDDILIYAKNCQKMKENVNAVLKMLMDHGVKINPDKNEFFQTRLGFLGYRLEVGYPTERRNNNINFEFT